VQQPTAPQFGQSPAPGGDALYNALVQNNGNFGVVPGTAGTPGIWGGLAQGAGTALGAKALFHCLPGGALIDIDRGQKPIRDVQAGDRFGDFTVMMKYEYISQPTPFVQIELSDGAIIEMCDKHLINGKEAQAYVEGDNIQGRRVIRTVLRILDEKTYDLLTNAPDGGYNSNGIHIQSMIPTLHKAAHLMLEVQ